MQFYYLQSPHKQINEDFDCRVVKVHDGDTIRVNWKERDFDFPIRFSNIAAPELNEEGGRESQAWLENKILNEEVTILVDPNNKVEKWGRLLGRVIHRGIDVGEEQIFTGLVTSWNARNEGKLIDPVKKKHGT